MSLQIDPSSTDSGTAAAVSLTPTEIVTAIVPALVGMVAIGLIAVLMLL